MRRVCLIPDLESYSFLEEVGEGVQKTLQPAVLRDSFEEMLSATASLAVRLCERGILCALLIPSYAEEESTIVIPEDAETAVPALLTAIAQISYSGGKTALRASLTTGQEHLLGQPFVLCREEQSAALKNFAKGTLLRPIGIQLQLPEPPENEAEDAPEPVLPDPDVLQGKELGL